jgi:hypothetical protein
VLELHVKAGLAYIAANTLLPLLLSKLMIRLCHYIESILLAENLQRTVFHIAMLLGRFSQLASLAQAEKPFLYRKRHSLSLLFDIDTVQTIYP